MPQLRQNIVTGEWVVIAPERAKRPSDFVTVGTHKKEAKVGCAFCAGGNAWKERFARPQTKNIYVTPNKFPAFVESEKDCETRAYHPEKGFYLAKPSIGGHEIISTFDHDLDLPKFPLPIMREMLEVIQQRYQFYRQQGCVEYVMGIYNHGQEAGASIEHAHAQLFASTIIPNIILREKQGSENYHDTNGTCVFCDLIAHEKKEKVRVLVENDDFILFAFFAARFPFEMWILPKAHESQYEKVDGKQMNNLAKILLHGLHLLDITLNDPPVNFFIHTLPTTSEESDYYHWHLEIAPRVASYGGYEMGSGTIIDVVSPEKATEFLQATSR